MFLFPLSCCSPAFSQNNTDWIGPVFTVFIGPLVIVSCRHSWDMALILWAISSRLPLLLWPFSISIHYSIPPSWNILGLFSPGGAGIRHHPQRVIYYRFAPRMTLISQISRIFLSKTRKNEPTSSFPSAKNENLLFWWGSPSPRKKREDENKFWRGKTGLFGVTWAIDPLPSPLCPLPCRRRCLLFPGKKMASIFRRLFQRKRRRKSTPAPGKGL